MFLSHWTTSRFGEFWSCWRACRWWGSRLEHPNCRWKRLLYSFANMSNLRCSSGLMDQGGGVQVEVVFSLGSYVVSLPEVSFWLVLK